jgi:sulfide dehydrogenase [flavocytochrome c] flavoprotein subunit
MTQKLSRRNFLKATGVTTAAAATGAVGGIAATTAFAAVGKVSGATVGTKAELPKAKGPRVVVVGGGWSGLSLAKYLKKDTPSFDVVLVERRSTFMSCPISNLWLAGVVDLEFLSHSFLDAAKNNNYTFLNATVIGADRDSRKIYTDVGYIGYDYLVLAPGIDYDYSRVGVTDIDEIFELKTKYPAGFIPGSENLSIKNKLAYFDGGTFMLTVPSGNYRCLPGPYERTCMVASIFKREKIKGKVLLLDANPDITIKKEGFHNAFNKLYKDIVEYAPGVEIKSVDVGKKEVKTDFETYQFDDAALYPGVRGSVLLETLGVVDPVSPQKEANIDVLKYNVIGDERVFAAGDARPMPFSKSGNTANSEARYVSRVVSARAAGKDIEWESPNTICYSAVKIDPLESITVDAHYKYNPADKSFAFANVKLFEEWSKASGEANLEWARGLYRDMFS